MKLTKATALVLLGMALPGVWSLSSARAADEARNDERTNIVLMLIDNVGYGDLGCYGNREVRTPQIDRLAGQGVRCTDYYTASPSCSPSRAALLTGRYPERNGLTEQLPSEEHLAVGLRRSEVLLPHDLKARGYVTACFGKWNIGFLPGCRPTERGFDEFFGHASGNMDYYTHIYNGRNDLYRGTESVRVDGYSTDLFADAACEFIRRNRDRPFFAYVPFNAAHYPNPRNKKPGEPVIWQAPREAFEAYGYPPDEPDETKRYRAVLTALDSGIGRIVGQVDSLGLGDRTLIILMSDNGAFMLKARGLEVASNKPLRDGGVTLYEGGIRVPCVFRWPGRFRPGTVCREPLISLDLYALALRAAGAPAPTDRVLDGRDPTPLLAGEPATGDRSLFFTWEDSVAARRGRYKLFRAGKDEPFRLYDLANDLGETRDIAAEKPDVVASLRREFDDWLTEVRRSR
jgi:arylsulfatase A-like enzyme